MNLFITKQLGMSEVILPMQFQKILTIAKAFISTVPNISLVLEGHYNIIFESNTISELYFRWVPLFWNFLRNPRIPFEEKLRLFLYCSPQCEDKGPSCSKQLIRMNDEQLTESLSKMISRNNRLKNDPIYYNTFLKERQCREHFEEFLQLIAAYDKVQKAPVNILVDPFYFSDAELKRKQKQKELSELLLCRLKKADGNTLGHVFNYLKQNKMDWDIQIDFQSLSMVQLKELLSIFD